MNKLDDIKIRVMELIIIAGNLMIERSQNEFDANNIRERRDDMSERLVSYMDLGDE